MGSFGIGVWENDAALDIVEEYKDALLERLELINKEVDYNRIEKLMALVEIYASLPNINADDLEKVTPYIELISNQDFAEWKEPEIRKQAIEDWINSLSSLSNSLR